ncbi:MAG: glycosyltransferase [Cyclonatronaceae bacterium]
MYPIVASIIIPVFNDAVELKKVLNALHNQRLVNGSFQVIVVDNGSADKPGDIVKGYDGVEYLIENRHLNSPYSCRNRGLEIAKGDVIVLLDGTCIPEPDWLEQGLKCINDRGADIVSSHVEFDFRGRITAGKLYDSNNLSTERAMKENGVAKTASLFIRKKVFDAVGPFPEGVRSGADVRWTRKASAMGFRMEYCYESVAKKKARFFVESVKKQWRVGKGQPAIRKEQGNNLNPFRLLVSSMIPPRWGRVKKLAANKNVTVDSWLLFRLYFVAWFIWIVMGMANVYGTWFLEESDSRFSDTGSVSEGNLDSVSVNRYRTS